MRRHLERSQFNDAKSARRTVGRVQLVNADFSTMSVAGKVYQKMPE